MNGSPSLLLRDIDFDDSSWWEPLMMMTTKMDHDDHIHAILRIHNDASALLFDEKLSKEHYFQICCFVWIQQQQNHYRDNGDYGGSSSRSSSTNKPVQTTTCQLWHHIKSSYLEGRRQEKSMVQWILPDLNIGDEGGEGCVNNNDVDDDKVFLELIEDRMNVQYIDSSVTGRGDGDNDDLPTRMAYTACIIDFFRKLYVATTKSNGTSTASRTIDDGGGSGDDDIATSGRPSKRRRIGLSYQSTSLGSTFYYDSSNGGSSATTHILKGHYKLPAVYLLISVLLKQQQQQKLRREEKQRDANNNNDDDDNFSPPVSSLVSWKSLRVSAHAISSIFKTMTEQDIQAGLALVGLQSLQQRRQQQFENSAGNCSGNGTVASSPTSIIDGLTIPSVINEYFANNSSCGLSILPTLQEALFIGPYTIRAAVCNQLLDRILDESTTDEYVCLKCLDMDDPKRYISRLQTIQQQQEEQPKNKKRLLTSTHNSSGVPEDVSSHAYPIMTHLQVLLVAKEDRRAANLAHEIDKCSTFTPEQKKDAWDYVWGYLLDNGQIFLDNNVKMLGYTEKRDFLFNVMVSGSSKGARKVMMDFYEELSKRADESDQATPEEKYYVIVACQQTTLRLLLKACGLERRTIQLFLAQTKWPIPLPPYSPDHRPLDDWAASFLQQYNPIPFSLINQETNDVDLSRLLYQDPATPESVPVVDTDMLTADDDALPSAADVDDKETPIAASRLEEPSVRDNEDDFATYGTEAEVEETYELEDGTRVPAEAVRLGTGDDRLEEDVVESEEDYFEAHDDGETQPESAGPNNDNEQSYEDDVQEENKPDDDIICLDDDDDVEEEQEDDDADDEEEDVEAYEEGNENVRFEGRFIGEKHNVDYDDDDDDDDEIDDEIDHNDDYYSDEEEDDENLRSVRYGPEDEEGDDDEGDIDSSEDDEEQDCVGVEEPEAIVLESDDEEESSDDAVVQVVDTGSAEEQDEGTENPSHRETSNAPLHLEEIVEREDIIMQEESNGATDRNKVAPVSEDKSETVDAEDETEVASSLSKLRQSTNPDGRTNESFFSSQTEIAPKQPSEQPSIAEYEPTLGNPLAKNGDDGDHDADSVAGTVDERDRMSEEEEEEAHKAETTPLAGEKFGSTTDEEDFNYRSKANQAAEEGRRADVLRARAHNHIGYASQLEDGYEPEDTHGYTEEEASEAIHTEDEQEERSKVRFHHRPAQLGNTTEHAHAVNAVEPASNDMPHSSDDMDMADEHTEHEEIDLGAESSELEDVAETGVPTEMQRTSLADAPLSISALSGGDPTSLVDFASSAQRQHDWSRSGKMSNETTLGATDQEHQYERQPDEDAALSFDADADDEKDQTEASHNIETEEEAGNTEILDEGENEDSMGVAPTGPEDKHAYRRSEQSKEDTMRFDPSNVEGDNLEKLTEDLKPTKETFDEAATKNNDDRMPSNWDDPSAPTADGISTESRNETEMGVELAGPVQQNQEVAFSIDSTQYPSDDHVQDTNEDVNHGIVADAAESLEKNNSSGKDKDGEDQSMEPYSEHPSGTTDANCEELDGEGKQLRDAAVQEEANAEDVNNESNGAEDAEHDELNDVKSKGKEAAIESKEQSHTQTNSSPLRKTPLRKGASAERAATIDAKEQTVASSPEKNQNIDTEKDRCVPASINVGWKAKSTEAGSTKSGDVHDDDDISTVASTLTTPPHFRDRRTKGKSTSPVEEVKFGGSSNAGELGGINEEGWSHDSEEDEKKVLSLPMRRLEPVPKAKASEGDESVASSVSNDIGSRATRSLRGRKGSKSTENSDAGDDVVTNANEEEREKPPNLPAGRPPRPPRATRGKKATKDAQNEENEESSKGANSHSTTRSRTRSKRNPTSKESEREEQTDDDETVTNSVLTGTSAKRTHSAKSAGVNQEELTKRVSKRSRKIDENSTGETDSVATESSITRRQSARKKMEQSDDEHDDRDDTVASISTTKSSLRSRTKTQSQSKGEDTNAEASAPPRRHGRSRKSEAPQDETAGEEDERATSAPKRATRSRKNNSDDLAAEEEESPSSAKRITRGRQKQVNEEATVEQEEESMTAPARTTKRGTRDRKRMADEVAVEDEEGVEESLSDPSRKIRTRGRRKTTEDADDNDDVDNDEPVPPPAPAARRNTRGRMKTNSEETNDDESIASAPTRRGTRSRKTKASNKEEETNDDESMTSAPTRRSTRSTRGRKK